MTKSTLCEDSGRPHLVRRVKAASSSPRSGWPCSQRALSKARLEHGKLSLSPETTKAPASPASETQKLQAHTRWRYSKWSRSQGEFCTGAIMGLAHTMMGTGEPVA
uniref:Uncharacterized protein n=1 Tax=Rousettus aegyptiacus TaxID=9407 RepID=A0A7J8E8R9_ROUAE|nr:hypothetical protein HJG63_008089 [Rousettus aegyptiacus]